MTNRLSGWHPDVSVNTTWEAGSLAPVEVLYEMDGPSIYVVAPPMEQKDGIVHLCFKASEDDIFLLTVLSPRELATLKTGQLSVLGAIGNRPARLVQIGPDHDVQRFQVLTPAQALGYMPAPGVALYVHHGHVPDRLPAPDRPH